MRAWRCSSPLRNAEQSRCIACTVSAVCWLMSLLPSSENCMLVPRRISSGKAFSVAFGGFSTDSAQGLAAVQPKMQAWLGRLGSWADALALGPVAAEQEQDISKRWDAKDMIGLKVSFLGMENSNPVLWLDSLLPLVSPCTTIPSSARPLPLFCTLLLVLMMSVLGMDCC